ncbi:MAG: SRPBCC family protein, partial [bacterium]
MQISDSIEIFKPTNIVWSVITDIENSIHYISSILNIEILDKPREGFVGFKWKETRSFMGKETSETMWITESQTNQSYVSRA